MLCLTMATQNLSWNGAILWKVLGVRHIYVVQSARPASRLSEAEVTDYLPSCSCCEYMAAVGYLKANAEKLQDGRRPLHCRSTWSSALAPHGVFGRPQRFTIHTFSEEIALVRTVPFVKS